MNLFKRAKAEEPVVPIKGDQKLSNQNEKKTSTTSQVSQNEILMAENSSYVEQKCGSDSNFKEETMITEEEFDKIIKEENELNLRYSNEETQNSRNNLVNTTIKVPNIKVFEQLVNQELKLGSWIKQDPNYEITLKQKSYVENLYKTIYSKTSFDSAPLQANYLKDLFNPNQNTIDIILDDISRYEDIRFPSLASTQLYLRRLYQLKDILDMKDSDGSKRYVKDGSPFNHIPIALATELEAEINKSIVSKPGISALYRDPKKRLSAANLNSIFGNSIICLGKMLERRIEGTHQPKVSGMIEIINALKANNLGVLKTYEEKVGEDYIAARDQLKKVNAELHFGDILKLVALSVPSAMSPEFNLQIFVPATIKN